MTRCCATVWAVHHSSTSATKATARQAYQRQERRPPGRGQHWKPSQATTPSSAPKRKSRTEASVSSAANRSATELPASRAASARRSGARSQRPRASGPGSSRTQPATSTAPVRLVVGGRGATPASTAWATAHQAEASQTSSTMTVRAPFPRPWTACPARTTSTTAVPAAAGAASHPRPSRWPRRTSRASAALQTRSRPTTSGVAQDREGAQLRRATRTGPAGRWSPAARRPRRTATARPAAPPPAASPRAAPSGAAPPSSRPGQGEESAGSCSTAVT